MITRNAAYFLIICFLISLLPHAAISHNKDSLQVLAGVKQAEKYLDSDLDSAVFFTNQLLRNHKLSAEPWVKARVLYLKSHIQYQQGAYHEALQGFLKSLAILDKKSTDPLLSELFLKIGDTYQKTDSLKMSLNWYLKALDHLVKRGDEVQQINLLNKLGILHCKMEDHLQEKEHFRLALQKSSSAGDQPSLAQSYQNIGVSYLHLQKYDSAISFLEQSRLIYNKLGVRYKLARISNNLGVAYVHQQSYARALAAYQEAISLYQEFGNLDSQGNTLHNIGEAYMLQAQYDLALRYYFESLQIADSLKNHRLRYSNYEEIARVYSRKGDFRKAYEYNVRYAALRDSVLNHEVTRQVNELKEKHQAEALASKNKMLEQEKVLQQAEISQKTLERNGLLLLLGLLSLATLLIIFSLWHRYRLQKARVAQGHAERERQISELLKQQEIQFLDASVQGQQLERQRIAADLHDRLGSLLATVKLYFSNLLSDKPQSLSERHQQHLNTATELLDQACSEVRLIAHNLSGSAQHPFQLVEALQNLRDLINQSQQLQLQLLFHGLKQKLPASIEVNTYRIIQEIVSNVLRHAEAKTLTIQLSLHQDGNLNVMIEDDGKGFDTSTHRSGMGLGNIEARMQLLGGHWFIDSHPGRGTSIVLDIPTQEEAITLSPGSPAAAHDTPFVSTFPLQTNEPLNVQPL